MKAVILNSSYVIDFPGDEFTSEVLESIMRTKTEKILQKIGNKVLEDWTLYFRFRYNNVKHILIYRNAKSYTKEKYKEIIIHIPIPTKDIVSWGVNKEQHVYHSNTHLDDKMKNFSCLNVDFFQYENCKGYLLDCMWQAIEFCFKDGFTINGIKVKSK